MQSFTSKRFARGETFLLCQKKQSNARAKTTLPDTIAAINALLRGWTAYFRYGYPRHAFRKVNYYLHVRFRGFLRNRSQRRSRPFRRGESLSAGLHRYGLHYL